MKETQQHHSRMDQDLACNKHIRTMVFSSDVYATELYSALCNNVFFSPTQDPWRCSWRYAAALIAKLRDEGTYLDWYNSGNEGFISDRISTDLHNIGWSVMPFIDLNHPEWQRVQAINHTSGIALQKKTPPPGGFRIALVGEAGSGKNTLGSRIEATYADVFCMAFANDLKIMCAEMINYVAKEHDLKDVWFSEWNLPMLDDQKHVLRPIWQAMGTDIIRAKYPFYWINRLALRINANPLANRIIITDCRFPNEADWARENGFLIARITGRKSGIPAHESEQALQDITPDMEFENVDNIQDLVSWGLSTVVPAAMALGVKKNDAPTQ